MLLVLCQHELFLSQITANLDEDVSAALYGRCSNSSCWSCSGTAGKSETEAMYTRSFKVGMGNILEFFFSSESEMPIKGCIG